MSRLIYLPTESYLNLALIMLPISMAMISFRMWVRSRTFKPGSQVMNTIARMKNKPSMTRDKNAKELIKNEVREKEKDNFNITAKRLGIDMTYDDNMQRRRIVLIPALMVMLSGMAMGLALITISDILTVTIVMISVLGAGYMIFKFEVLFLVKKKSLYNDMTKDLSRLVTLYMYSDSKRGIHGAIQDFRSDATALGVDLDMFIADLNSFELSDALDRLSARVPLGEMKSFVSYAKSANTMTAEQVTFSLMTLDSDIRKRVVEIMDKEVRVKFNIALALIVVCFIGAMLVFMAPQIAEIDLNMF